MTETEYQMAVQRTHDAYCKTVIRHAAITAIRRLQRKWEREISLEYLMYEKHFSYTICAGHLPPPAGGKAAEPSAATPAGQGPGTMKEQAARQRGATLQKGATTEDRQEKKTAQAAASAKYREGGVPQQELERFARFLLPKIQAFYQSEEGKRLFEEWKKNRR